MIALVFIAAIAGFPVAQSEPSMKAPFAAPCDALKRLPDGRWQTTKPIVFGSNKLAAGTILGKGGDVDEVQVNGVPIRTDINERCESKPG